MSGLVSVVLLCITILSCSLAIPPFNIFFFSFTVSVTALLKLPAGLVFILCFHSSLISTLLASSELKTKQTNLKTNYLSWLDSFLLCVTFNCSFDSPVFKARFVWKCFHSTCTAFGNSITASFVCFFLVHS